MVKHIIDRISSSTDIRERYVKIAAIKNGKPVKWYVSSSWYSAEYLVFINDEYDTEELHQIRQKHIEGVFNYSKIHGMNPDLPHCECRDWKKHQLPCKHIIAVMHIYNFDWCHFPENYQKSPFFSVNEDVVGILTATNSEPSHLEDRSGKYFYTDNQVTKESPVANISVSTENVLYTELSRDIREKKSI